MNRHKIDCQKRIRKGLATIPDGHFYQNRIENLQYILLLCVQKT